MTYRDTRVSENIVERSFADGTAAQGVAAETAVLKHLFACYYAQSARFSYWRQRRSKSDPFHHMHRKLRTQAYSGFERR